MALWDSVNLTRIEEWGLIRKGLFWGSAILSLIGLPAMFVWLLNSYVSTLSPSSDLTLGHPQPVEFAVPRIHPEIDCVAALDAYASETVIYFGTNSATIGEKYHDFVREVSDRLADCDNAEVFLIGHADGTGSDTLNTEISLRRAEAFIGILVAHNRSIVKYRTFAQGARESVLLGDAGIDDQQLNRRLQLEVKYIDKLLKP